MPELHLKQKNGKYDSLFQIHKPLTTVTSAQGKVQAPKKGMRARLSLPSPKCTTQVQGDSMLPVGHHAMNLDPKLK